MCKAQVSLFTILASLVQSYMPGHSKPHRTRKAHSRTRIHHAPLVMGLQRHCAIQCINGMCAPMGPCETQVFTSPSAVQVLRAPKPTATPHCPLAKTLKNRRGRGKWHRGTRHTRRHHSKRSYPIWYCSMRGNKMDCKRQRK